MFQLKKIQVETATKLVSRLGRDERWSRLAFTKVSLSQLEAVESRSPVSVPAALVMPFKKPLMKPKYLARGPFSAAGRNR